VARYIATTSDHHAYLLRLELAGLATLPQAAPPDVRAGSLYWKLNTSVLRDPAFLPAFREVWGGAVAEKPPDPAAAAGWWESTAKPIIVSFCQDFSRILASRRLQRRRFFTRALELALEAGDWAAVGACRRRLREMDAWAAQGAAIRSHTPLVEDELAGLFHIASEGKTGQSSGLQSVLCSSTGAVLSDPEAVQQEVFSFYEAIFQGRHAAAEGAEAPVDSGSPFVPDEGAYGQFLNGLPRLSGEQRASLEAPFTLAEL
jgi:hypothetical protein